MRAFERWACEKCRIHHPIHTTESLPENSLVLAMICACISIPIITCHPVRVGAAFGLRGLFFGRFKLAGAAGAGAAAVGAAAATDKKRTVGREERL